MLNLISILTLFAPQNQLYTGACKFARMEIVDKSIVDYGYDDLHYGVNILEIFKLKTNKNLDQALERLAEYRATEELRKIHGSLCLLEKLKPGKYPIADVAKLLGLAGEEPLAGKAAEACKEEAEKPKQMTAVEKEEKDLMTAVGEVQSEEKLFTAVGELEPPAKRICTGEEQQEAPSTSASTTHTAQPQGEAEPRVRFAAELARMRGMILGGELDEEKAIRALLTTNGNFEEALDYYPLCQKPFP